MKSDELLIWEAYRKKPSPQMNDITRTPRGMHLGSGNRTFDVTFGGQLIGVVSGEPRNWSYATYGDDIKEVTWNDDSVFPTRQAAASALVHSIY